MLFFYIFLVLLAILALLFYLMIRGFKNPVNPHDKVPKDFGVKVQEINFPSVEIITIES